MLYGGKTTTKNWFVSTSHHSVSNSVWDPRMGLYTWYYCGHFGVGGLRGEARPSDPFPGDRFIQLLPGKVFESAVEMRVYFSVRAKWVTYSPLKTSSGFAQYVQSQSRLTYDLASYERVLSGCRHLWKGKQLSRRHTREMILLGKCAYVIWRRPGVPAWRRRSTFQ